MLIDNEVERDKVALSEQFINKSHMTLTAQRYRFRTHLMDITVFHVW